MKRRDLLKTAAVAVARVRAASAAGQPAEQISTVLEPVPPAALGRTLMHEHILVDFVGADKIGPGRYDGEHVRAVIAPRLAHLKSRGCGTLVDCTPAYQGRDPELLARLSQETGLHLLTNTGLYGAAGCKFLPGYVYSETADQLAARWISEFREGIPPAGIRPAFIKIGVDAGPLSEVGGKLVRAAALTHLRTGIPIVSHTGDGLAALAQLKVLTGCGVPAGAFIWAHAQDENDGGFYQKGAETGAWIEFDSISPRTADRNIGLIRQAKRQGYLQRLLISQDTVGYYVGQNSSGSASGYSFILDEFLPLLRKSGIDDLGIRTLLIDNPRRALTPRRRSA